MKSLKSEQVYRVALLKSSWRGSINGNIATIERLLREPFAELVLNSRGRNPQ
ncbi:hypothetical protein [Chlorobaculum sp. 24CR]|uniref:hypothetical protein n=1 Tax=Chlorobaculum sp. 24CR TaxID=2508878 RepID=UPI0014319A40|nr:hypothetical protein [Chlorobaculum sp. 24CR]